MSNIHKLLVELMGGQAPSQRAIDEDTRAVFRALMNDQSAYGCPTNITALTTVLLELQFAIKEKYPQY